MSLLRIAGLKCHNSPVTCSRDLFLNYAINGRKRIVDIVNGKIKTNLKQSIARKCDKPKQVPYIVKLSCGSLVLSYVLKSRFYAASCRASKPNNDLTKSHEPVSFKWKHLLKYLYPHFWYLLVAISSALIVAILNIWIPQCVGGIINVLTEVCKQKQSESSQRIFAQLAKPAFRLARMYASQALFTFVYIFSLSHMGEKLAAHLRQDLFKSIIMQDIAFFDQNRSGEIVSRLTTDIQDFKSTFKICISQGIRSVTQIIGCVISVIVISPKLTAAMVLSVPSIIFIGTLLGRTLHKLSLQAQNQIAKSTAVCEETIQNIKTVRAFAAENKETEHYSKEVELSAVLYEQLGFGIGLFQAGTNLFLNGILLTTLYFGGHLMSTGQLSPGDLMAFLMATQTIQRSLSQLSTLFGSYIRGISAGARVFEYLDMPPSSMMIGGESIADKSLMGNIIFKNVEFSYPTRPDQVILKNFNLYVPAGRTVAIVGSSGNGKSTVAALLERFYDVDDGSITIDGRDIRSLNSSYLRGNVLGYIDQEPILFATSIMENIRYGKLSATDTEVVEAAKQANAHDFIVKFPNGYKTKVGERGTQLSGGQKQRVAIARALLKHPSILILDEATSALDYESERVVQNALENAAQGRTVLVIAHRLSTIKNADLIVVLQCGVIVEMGTHADLIKKKGTYYTLVNEQEKENV